MSTMMEMLEATAAAHPDDIAVVAPGRHSLRYTELLEAVGELRADLAGHGVRRGDVVGVWLPNWTETLVWEFATASIGAAVLGINTRYGVHELSHLLHTARPVCLAMPRELLGLDFAGRLETAASEVDGDPPAVAIVDGTGPLALPDWQAPAEPAEPDTGRAEDPVNYFTTSGSTGLPKLAGHDQNATATHARNDARAFGMRAGDAVLCVLPLSGVFGFNPAMAVLSAGGACVLHPVFSPGEALRQMRDYGVTHLVGGDDMIGRLMDVWSEQPVALPSLRRGGIADFTGRSVDVTKWAAAEFGTAISGVYGSSELFALASVWPADLDLADRVRGGGKAVSPEISVRVADPETGAELAEGETGELQFTGYNVLPGYLANPDATSAAFTQDGWFRSGDLGMLADGGFVYLCRRGEELRLRGNLVQPAEIEGFLTGHPDVDTACVVGAKNDKGADVAVGFVTLVSGARHGEDELIGFCAERLAAFKVPSRIVTLDEFPMTTGTNGSKIRKGELRKMAAEL
jgi:fatty-acyl-CoA synthase